MFRKIGAGCLAALEFSGAVCLGVLNTILEQPSFTVALFSIVVVPFAGHAVYDRLYNYSRATVQVSKVERICYVSKRDGKRSDERLSAESCEALRQKVASGETVENLRIRDNTVVSFQYTSPVDGEIHLGQLERNASAKAPEVDDQIQVLISRVDPTVVRD